MAESAKDLFWKIAESDEIEIQTRRDETSPAHRTIIWIVPTEDGVYVRSYKGKRGRWYQEGLANPLVTVHVGRRKVRAKVELEKNDASIRKVSAAFREKYGERWPDETREMLRRSVLQTTLRLSPV
ncbi:MAG: DUF2255 family protein [Candidatus Dormibacter sp.]